MGFARVEVSRTVVEVGEVPEPQTLTKRPLFATATDLDVKLVKAPYPGTTSDPFRTMVLPTATKSSVVVAPFVSPAVTRSPLLLIRGSRQFCQASPPMAISPTRATTVEKSLTSRMVAKAPTWMRFTARAPLGEMS